MTRLASAEGRGVRRLLTMLAHLHGGMPNVADLARSFAIREPAIRPYARESMEIARADLKLDRVFVVHAGGGVPKGRRGASDRRFPRTAPCAP